MATKKRTPPTKKRSARTKKSRAQKRAAVPLFRFIILVLLVLLLIVSLGVASYVIFFRVAIAAELLFEEPVEQQHRHVPDFGAPAGRTAAKSRVAIIIDDMGYHKEIGLGLLELPMNLSFSFLPHAPFTRELEEKAYRLGRTVLLHLPLEPRSSEWDPGPGALYIDESPAQRAQSVAGDFLQVPHATGVNNHMGSRFTEARAVMEELFDLLAEREVFFIDSYTSSASLGLQLAHERGIPASRRDVFLDNSHDRDTICGQLEELARLARVRGRAVGIGHPHRGTLEALQECGPDALGAVDLVGVEELVQ